MHTTTNIITDIRNGLTDDQIMSAIPSVFATSAHSTRSSQYMFLPTYEILNNMRIQGFVPTQVVRQRSRMDGQETHGKHFIRFRHVNDLHTSRPEAPEIGVQNSHNGDSGLRAVSGMISFVCENGCVFGNFKDTLSVRHRGRRSMLDEILNTVFQLAADSVQIMEQVEWMRGIMLSWEEQLVMAEAAMVKRFEDKVTIVESDNGPSIDRSLVPFQPEEFLRAQRPSDFVVGGRSRYDRGNRNLQTTYQVLQENMVQRPITSLQRSQQSGRRGHIRAINGIEGNVKMNAALWVLTQRMAELKG